MFEYLKGMLVDKFSTKSGFYLVVEVAGIGYRLETSELEFYNVGDINNEVKIYTSLVHKEDTMFLCGFLMKETRDIFKILTYI